MHSSLCYSSDDQDGYTRRKWGRGFIYLDEQHDKLLEPTILARIKALKIPPNWKRVWICKNENGHLQCTGRDDKRRKQYLYHEEWIEYRQRRKFKKLLAFARQLPQLRRKIDKDLKEKTWVKNKVIALALSIMDHCNIRIGNKQYKDRNGTYGLTTLRRKHLLSTEDGLKLAWKAKKGKLRKVDLHSRKLIRLIQECSELPGYEIFRYIDAQGNFHALDSSDVNEYIHNSIGNSYTAKDLRTWSGTSMAILYLPEAIEIANNNTRKKLSTSLIKLVAKQLGNTQKVCREYYIHPGILEMIESGTVPFESNRVSHPWMADYELITLHILESFYKNDHQKQLIKEAIAS